MLMETRIPATPTCAAVEVVRIDAEQRRIWFRRDDEEFDEVDSAVLAIPGPNTLRIGDRALVTGGLDDEFFVIGVLTENDLAPSEVRLNCGVRAQATETERGGKLQVLSEEGELLFEYDSATRNSRVRLGAERVQFVAPASGIDFIADGQIRFQSNELISMTGELGVELHGGAPEGQGGGTLSVGPHAIGLAAPRVKMSAEHLDVQAVNSRFTFQRLLGRSIRARLVSENLELVLGTVLQKAKHVIGKVSGWYELHAKNTRNVVEETAHVNAARVNVRAKGDVKIDGQQIHLG